MYGAIIGDLAGSIYEFEQTKKVHPVEMKTLIPEDAFFTDDTILTIAIADALLSRGDYGKYLKEYISMYKDYHPDFSPTFSSPFSPGMMKWARGEQEGVSTGNGAMMRISPVGSMVLGGENVRDQAYFATIPSHDSEEAIWSATTIALMIYYLKAGYSKKDVFQALGIVPQYKPFPKFNTTCLETIDNCLYSFYTSRSFYDAIAKTLAMGGDTDTNCCIVGSLAEAYYGVDEELKRQVDEKIPKEFVKVLRRN